MFRSIIEKYPYFSCHEFMLIMQYQVLNLQVLIKIGHDRYNKLNWGWKWDSILAQLNVLCIPSFCVYFGFSHFNFTIYSADTLVFPLNIKELQLQ